MTMIDEAVSYYDILRMSKTKATAFLQNVSGQELRDLYTTLRNQWLDEGGDMMKPPPIVVAMWEAMNGSKQTKPKKRSTPYTPPRPLIELDDGGGQSLPR